MRIITRSTLKSFWEKHADAEVPLKTWYKIVEHAAWRDTHDVKEIFSTASVVGENRIVFNIKGNKYRILVYAVFKYKKFFIRFVGTHQQYDRIDAKTI